MNFLGKDSNKNLFVRKGLDYLTRENSPYSHFFKDKDGRKLSDDVYRERISLLEESLNEAYENRAESKLNPGFSGYISSGLRGLAFAGYVGGSALFWTVPGPVGYGLTGVGAGLSLVADAIDSHYYHKAGLIKGGSFKDFRLAGESVLEKGLGYLPVFTGLGDLYRGRRKFVRAAIGNIVKDDDIIDYTISHFVEKLYQHEKDDNSHRIIPLSSLRDYRYIEDSKDNKQVVQKAA